MGQAAHKLEDAAPVVGRYFPAEQGKQLEEPGAVAYVPAAHAVHAALAPTLAE